MAITTSSIAAALAHNNNRHRLTRVPYLISVRQRRTDRQWTWHIYSANGQKIGWSGEAFHRKAAALKIVERLFGDRFPVYVAPAAKGRK